jgi:beta-lactamase class A
MVATDTGSRRLRAGLPADWRAGDKTGGTHGVANDIAVAWPPGRAPMLITAYYAEFSGTDEQRDAVLADVARIAVR